MARFTFRFATLLKVREMSEKERQRELAASIVRAEAAHKALVMVERQVAERQASARQAASGRLDPWRLMLAAEDLARLRSARRAAEERLVECRREVEVRREILVETAKGRKTLDVLRQREYELFLIEEARKEQRFMDELAQQAGEHLKRQESVGPRAGGGKKDRSCKGGR